MTALEANIGFAGLLWAVAAWSGAARRWHAPLALFTGLAVVSVGLFRGLVVAADLSELPGFLGLEAASNRVLLWAAFGVAAASAGWRETHRLAPVAFGALFGGLGGAFLSVAGVSDRRVAARRVLAAAAGALLSRVGNPACWVLMEGFPGSATDGWGTLGWAQLGWMGLLAVMGIVLANPPPVEDAQVRRPPMVLGIGLLVWGLSWHPALQTGAVGGGAVVLLLITRKVPPLSGLVGAAVGLVAGMVAVSAGAGEAVANLLEARMVDSEQLMPVWVWGAGAVSGLGLGADGGAVAGRAVLDRALAVRSPLAPVFWAMGASVSALGPLLLTATFRHGVARQVAWVLAAGGLVWLACWMGWLVP